MSHLERINPIPLREATELAAGIASRLDARGALDLRCARILGWIKGRDVAELRYSSFRSFCRERVDWSDTWLRLLIRLATCGLDLVQAAACSGALPLSLAVRAPDQIGQEEQAQWLVDVEAGKMSTKSIRRKPSKSQSILTVDVAGSVMLEINAARQLVRVVSGQAVSDQAADHFILAHHRAGTRGDQIVSAALEPKPPPPPLPAAFSGNDLASVLVGPWVEPATLADAVERLDIVLAARRERQATIGLLFSRLKDGKLYRVLGFDTIGALAQSFGVSPRTLERSCALATALEAHPVLAERGLSTDQIEQIAQVATEETVEAWAFVAHYTGVGELMRAVKMSQHVPRVLEMYLEATRIAGIARFDPAAPPSVTALGVVPTRATKTVALAASLRPPPGPSHDRVDADLPAAARWFLAAVRLPRQRGIGAVKERDHCTCRNPECGRITLRCHAHHYWFRSKGGSDAPINLGTFCTGCHLRIIHSGRLTITREGELTTYEFPDRTIVVLGAGTGE